MVARIKGGKSIRGILRYNEDKVQSGQARLVHANGFATDIDRLSFHQKLYRFELLNQLRPSVKANALHITLNFHPDDRLESGKISQVVAEYMEKIGFGEQPFIAYQHFDAHHPHVHIATTRIQRDGKAIDINKIGWRLSEPARKEIEHKYGLVKAEGKKLDNEPYLRPAIYGAAPTKKQLNNITKAVMHDYAYTSFAEYKAVLSQFNVYVDRGFEDSVMFEKKGLVYSIADQNGMPVGVPFKAGAFYEGATMKRLERYFERNLERRKIFRPDLKNRIDAVLAKYNGISRQTLLRELASAQVALVFRQNGTGLIYGATFIDHRNRAVFNGSDLGKAYSAKAIVERLSIRDEPRRFLQREPRMNFLEREREVDAGQRQGLLEGLLERADFDPLGELARKRKKKRNRGQSPSQDI